MPVSIRTLPGRLTAALVRWVVSHAFLTVLVAALFTASTLHYASRHLAIDTDTSKMIDPTLPHRVAQRNYRQAFSDQTGDVVIFTEAARATEAEDVADLIAAQLRTRPDIARSLATPGRGEFFATHGLLYLDPDELWAIDARLQSAQPFLGTLSNDPSLRGLFATLSRGLTQTLDEDQQNMLGTMFDRVSLAIEQQLAGKPLPIHWRDELFAHENAAKGPQRAFVMVEPTLETTSFQPATHAIDLLNVMLDEIRAHHPAVQIRVTGSDVLDSEELLTVGQDAKLTTALSFGLVGLVLFLGLRAWPLVTAVLITLACGLVWTAAFAVYFVGALNIISVCFAVLFIGMGVDFGIQYSMRYLEETARGLDRRHALIAAAEAAGGALALAAVGAAISFFAFVPTSYRGLAQLGIIAGFSMAVAWFANITLLPALLSFFRAPKPRRQAATPAASNDGWIYRHHRSVLFGTLILVIGCGLLARHTRFDLNPLNLKDPNAPGAAAFHALIADPNSTPYTIQVLAPSIAAATTLATQLKALPTVDKTITLESYIPQAQAAKLDIIEGLRLALEGVLEPNTGTPPSSAIEAGAINEFRAKLAVPPSATASARWQQSRTRLATALDHLTQQANWPELAVPALRQQLVGDLVVTLRRLAQLLEATEITAANLPAEIRTQYVAADGRARIQVFPTGNLNDNDAMRDFVQSVRQIAPTATDAPVELYEGSRVVISSCVRASVWALILTIILHIIVLNGVVDALLVAAPLVLAMLLTMATSVLFEVPFNFANIIALPLLIGLNNAYGAYLVVRNHATGHVGTLLASSTPRAVLFSGMTAIASFGVLGISKHPGMAGMGILISVALFYAILSALIVLPALMAVHERWTTSKREKGTR